MSRFDEESKLKSNGVTFVSLSPEDRKAAMNAARARCEVSSDPKVDEPCTMEMRLKAATPRLLIGGEYDGGDRVGSRTCIGEPLKWDKVLDEGYDPITSALARPVYWRVVETGEERFYISTFEVSAAEVRKAWGDDGRPYLDPFTGIAIARIEGLIQKIKSPGADQIVH